MAGPSDVLTCALCGEPSRYKCPRCNLRSCSLPCSQAHKVSSRCSGKRDRTAFVGMNDFTDANLASDYVLLEETGRLRDAAKKSRPSSTIGPVQVQAPQNLPPPLHALRRAALLRGTELRFLPEPFAARQANTTTLDRDTGRILWRVTFRFPDAPAGTELVSPRCPEEVPLGPTLVAALSSAPAAAAFHLSLIVDAAASGTPLALLMRREGAPGPASYHHLDPTAPLHTQLAHRAVVESVVVLVIPPADLSTYALAPAETRPAPPLPPVQAPGAGRGRSRGGGRWGGGRHGRGRGGPGPGSFGRGSFRGRGGRDRGRGRGGFAGRGPRGPR